MNKIEKKYLGKNGINRIINNITNKQNKTDNNLTTADKTIVGAINEGYILPYKKGTGGGNTTGFIKIARVTLTSIYNSSAYELSICNRYSGYTDFGNGGISKIFLKVIVGDNTNNVFINAETNFYLPIYYKKDGNYIDIYINEIAEWDTMNFAVDKKYEIVTTIELYNQPPVVSEPSGLVQFKDLKTSDKNIIGAINEVYDLSKDNSINLFDKDTNVYGWYDGSFNFHSTADWRTCEIDVSQYENVRIHGITNIGGYQVSVIGINSGNNKTWICDLNGINDKVINVANYVKIIVSAHTSDLNTVMVEAGTIKHSYQPYMGANTIPKAINNVYKISKDNAVNLFNINSGLSDDTSKIYIENNSIKFLNNNYAGIRWYDTELKNNTTYTLSFDLNLSSGGAYVGGFDNLIRLNNITENKHYVVTFTTPQSFGNHIAFSGTSDTSSGMFNNIMIAEGTTDYNYQPYIGADSIPKAINSVKNDVSDITRRNLLAGTNKLYTMDKTGSQRDVPFDIIDNFDLQRLVNKDVTFSFYLKVSGSRNNLVSGEMGHRFGFHGTLRWENESRDQIVQYPFTELLSIAESNGRVSSNVKLIPPDSTHTKLASLAVTMQLFTRPGNGNNETWEIGYPKLEIGSIDTGYIEAIEDKANRDIYSDNSINLGRRKDSKIGFHSTAEGINNTASGIGSHAEGSYTRAYGNSSHSEGTENYALSLGAHSEGYGDYELSEEEIENYSTGFDLEEAMALASELANVAWGEGSHTEGYGAVACGDYAHAEGSYCCAYREGAHVGGVDSLAVGFDTFAHGSRVSATNNYSVAFGSLNADMSPSSGSGAGQSGTLFVLGNGYYNNNAIKRNAFSVDYNGTVKASGTITGSTTADYAEFFEWADGNFSNEDRVGKFVTFAEYDENNSDNTKIRIANSTDDYIIGIVSGAPFVLGNGDNYTWNKMHLRDEFNRELKVPAPKMEEVETYELKDKSIEHFYDKDGNELTELERHVYDEDGNRLSIKRNKELVPVLDDDGNQVYEGTMLVLNPDYDPNKPYISRFDRAEWSPVGMLGVLSVYDDGTCVPRRYCKCNDDGIATLSNEKTQFYVIERLKDNIVKIMMK